MNMVKYEKYSISRRKPEIFENEDIGFETIFSLKSIQLEYLKKQSKCRLLNCSYVSLHSDEKLK